MWQRNENEPVWEEEKVAYGEKCLRLGLGLVERYLPSSVVERVFVGETVQAQIESLANYVGEILPFEAWSKLVARNDTSHDLLTMLEHAPDPFIIDCRVDALVMALALERHELTDSVQLSNSRFGEKTPRSAEVIAEKDEYTYYIHFGRMGLSADKTTHVIALVLQLPTARSILKTRYPRYRLNPSDIYELEHAVGNI